MAKTKSKIEKAIVDGLRGVLDFYPRGNETIIRSWPRNKGNSQTPASLKWTSVFVCFHLRFNEWRTGLDLSRFRYNLLHNWTLRDYQMSRYYGNVPPEYNLRLDQRDPWPPPCDDPHHRMFLAHPVQAGYSVIGGLQIVHKVTPAHPVAILFYRDPPRLLRRKAKTRGVTHSIASDFIPGSPPYDVDPMWPWSHPVGNYRSWRFWPLGVPGFFIYATEAHYKPPRHILPLGPSGLTVSPWYWFVILPGYGGGELGARLVGPHPFTEWEAGIYRPTMYPD